MDGILIIDKPKDMTSHDVVNIARGALKNKRIGHTGTLDPNATGLLVLACGRATKLVKYFTNDRKTYDCEIIIGKGYDTDDITGELTDELDASNIEEKEIRNALDELIGKGYQLPPTYSAVKVGGQKLYELARKKKAVFGIEEREIEIFSIDNVNIKYLDKTIEISLSLEVSKGTYIRAIARDLGKRLNNFGVLKDLRRTKVNKITLDDSYTIEQLRNNEVELKDPFLFLDLPKITLNDYYIDEINNGRFLDLSLFEEKTDTIIYNESGDVLAIYYYDELKNVMRMSVKWF